MAKQSPQAIWGGVQFSVDSLAVSDMKRNRKWRWAKHDLLAAPSIHQFIGVGVDDFTLSGEANHIIGGSMFQTDALATIADGGEAQILVIAGRNLQKWFMESLADGFGNLLDDGKAATNKFSCKFIRYK